MDLKAREQKHLEITIFFSFSFLQWILNFQWNHKVKFTVSRHSQITGDKCIKLHAAADIQN